MHRLVHFEIHAADPERAKAFYGGLFGWTFTQWGTEDYWFVRTNDADTMAGMNGAILRRRGVSPAVGQSPNAFVCTIDVEDVEASLAKAVAADAAVAMPTMAIKGVGHVCYCMDPEGNLFGMIQNDPNAQ